MAPSSIEAWKSDVETPLPCIRRLQERIMKILFDADTTREILEERLSEALNIAVKAVKEVRRGSVSPEELIIEKRVGRPPGDIVSSSHMSLLWRIWREFSQDTSTSTQTPKIPIVESCQLRC